jgi:hypothetical protein
MRRYVQGVALLAVCLIAVTPSCRRNQPSLIDRNQPPDTELWYAPPDSTEYEYLVHLYWRGVDRDGTTRRYIWAVQDTVSLTGVSWNPAERLADYRAGRITSRTDSVFSFTAYKDVNGVGVRKNRQAFFVASIDDNGVIDPFPAAVEFVATIGKLPQIHFTVHVGGQSRPYENRTPPADTVGMYTPFSISYQGTTTNGSVRGYQYFPLSTTIVVPGSGMWTDVDSLYFPNVGADELPAGVFRFAAKCVDDANAESQVDAGQFRTGVAQVVVNFDPDTWISEVKNTYFKGGNAIPVDVDFTDNVPDTVPYKSWINFRYYSHDDPRDVQLCSTTDPDECIDFQVRFVRKSARNSGATENSGWLPSSGVHDSDANSATDTNSVNIGSQEYDWFASGIDENGQRDGTPASFHVVGNYDPTLDTYTVRDHFGNPVNLAVIDTLRWNFYKGVGWPYDSEADTVQAGRYYKRFAFTLHATGHDHPKDPDGSAVRSWRYYTYTHYNDASNTGTYWALGRAGDSWFPGSADNVMDDRVEVLFRYFEADGSDLFAALPGFLNEVLSVVLYGRDTRLLEPAFDQYVFWTLVPAGLPAGSGIKPPNLINSFPAEQLGRWTPKQVASFYLKLER